MKKRQILSILLASAMVMSMTACGGSNSSSDSSDASSTSSSNTKSDDSSSGDKKKITITWRDDGTDIKVNPNYVAMQEAYENWDKKMKLNWISSQSQLPKVITSQKLLCS